MLLPRNNYSFSHLFMNFTIFLAVLHVGSSFPDEGLNPCLLQGKHEVWTAREVATNIFEGLLYARHCAQSGSDSLRPHGVYPPPPKLCPPAPLSIGFSRQEYCMGLSFLLPGDLPDLGIQSMSPASLVLAG